MNLYQKLVEVKKSVSYLKKEADGHQYKYVSSSQVLGELRSKMNELNLLLVPSVRDTKVSEDMVVGTDKFGAEKHTTTYFTEIHMDMTWIDADNPDDRLTSPWYAQGVDIAGEKGVGKAYTYAEKYFLLKFFNIPTDKDDPDSFQRKHEDTKPHPKANVKQLATPAQRNQVNAAIKRIGMGKEEFYEIVGALGFDYAEMTPEQWKKLMETLATYEKPKEAAQ